MEALALITVVLRMGLRRWVEARGYAVRRVVRKYGRAGKHRHGVVKRSLSEQIGDVVVVQAVYRVRELGWQAVKVPYTWRMSHMPMHAGV